MDLNRISPEDFQIEVKDLLRFYYYLSSLGITLIPIEHTILLDDMEEQKVSLFQESQMVGSIEALFVDNHYTILRDYENHECQANNDASIEHFSKDMMESMRNRWMSPVKLVQVKIPAIFEGALRAYVDDYPCEEARIIVTQLREELGFTSK